MNNRKLFTLIIVFAIVILTGAGCNSTSDTNTDSTTNIVSDNSTSGSNEVTANEPSLKMTIVEYQRVISNFCENIEFALQVENVGEKAIAYSDFEEDYVLKLMSDDAYSTFDSEYPVGIVDTTFAQDEHGILTYDKVLEDFGELAPGDKGTIRFKSLSYVINGENEYYMINNFFNIANGTGNYYFVFGKLAEKKTILASMTELSRSNSVEITSDIIDPSDGVRKACEYELIVDESINFYE